MAQESILIKPGPKEIQEEIEATRSDLTDKLVALEHKVRETMAEAKSAISDTIGSVKHAVESTICSVENSVHGAVVSVKGSLDIGRQVDRHPWAMLAGAVAAGFVTGRLLDKPTTRQTVSHPVVACSPPNGNGRHGDSASFPKERAGLLSELGDRFGPEIDQLKGLAIGSVMSLAREFIKDAVAPALAPELERVIDGVTSKLGGKPIHGELWPHGDRFRRAGQTDS
jgi:ElaB/YqjD/DUF883 family membrane-anchored ribosome-binding protein